MGNYDVYLCRSEIHGVKSRLAKFVGMPAKQATKSVELNDLLDDAESAGFVFSLLADKRSGLVSDFIVRKLK